MIGARESGWRSIVKGWLVFVAVAVVAVAAVQAVDLATRRNGTPDEIAALRASVESLAAEVRELRGTLEATEAEESAVGRERREGATDLEAEEKTVITVYGDGTYAIGGTPCTANELSDALDALAEAHPGGKVVIVAQDAAYETVAALMGQCEQRGLKIAGNGINVPQGGQSGEEPTGVNLEPVDILLEMDAARELTLDGRKVARDDLKAELTRLLKANPAMRLVVRAPESVPMTEVQELLDIAGGAGIYRVDTEAAGGDETPDGSE
jgi:biopolymer transport protein ExbD